MEYNWLKITDINKVNDLLKIAQRDIRIYNSRKTVADVRNVNLEENSSEHAEELQEVQADLDASTAKLATLTAGTRQHAEETVNWKKLDLRKSQLDLDGETTGESSTLLKIYRSGKNELLLAEAIKFEAGGQAQKTALGG